MAIIGIYLLSGGHLSALTTGDVLTVVCAVVLGDPDHARRHDGFADGTAACAFGGAIRSHRRSARSSWPRSSSRSACEAITAAAPEILYVGIFSSGVAFVLQVIGQRYTTPSQAAIFLSSEALFGSSLGALLLGETMPPLGYAGCALMFSAMLVVEVVPELAKPARQARLKTASKSRARAILKKISRVRRDPLSLYFWENLLRTCIAGNIKTLIMRIPGAKFCVLAQIG